MDMEKILYKELSYKLVGCIYEVYNKIGSGFKESVYQNALKVELKEKDVDFTNSRKALMLGIRGQSERRQYSRGN